MTPATPTGDAGLLASHWLATTPRTDYPRLAQPIEVEVAVIGAGIAGICTAWEIARTGRSVAVLEARHVAETTTGHTTGKLTALHGLRYTTLRSIFGTKGAQAYAQVQQAAIDRVFSVAAELAIDCDLERQPAVTYVESAAATGQIDREVEAANEAGLDAEKVTDTDLPYPVAAGIRVADQAQFHPRKYLLGLCRDLTDLGGQIFEHTRITGLDEGSPCTLTAENGCTVRASSVVVSTNYPIFDRAMMFARLAPKREFVIAARLPEDQDPHGMYVTAENHTRSVRTAPLAKDQRLLIVTGESFRPGSRDVAARRQRLVEWTHERFPDADVESWWAAQDNTTTDQMPFIGPLHPFARHVWVAAGFGGWGMSNGVAAGQLLALMTAGETPEEAKPFDPRRVHPVREALPFAKAQVSVARHFVGDRLTDEMHRSTELGLREGAVTSVAGHKRAVYRDEQGAYHVLSATCTHLGCPVRFNDAEERWECPCHGSRFDPVDGSVAQGPATQPLAVHPVDDARSADNRAS